MLRILSFLCLCLSLLITVAAGPATAAERTPLLQEGKKTLYQRVITHPGARILQRPDAAASVVQTDVKPFTVLYVYARDNGWLEVGPAGNPPQGWVAAAQTTEWNQSLTLLFTDRASRAPVLFFKTEKLLADLCNAKDMEQQLASLEKAIAEPGKNAAPAPQLPVLAMEPPDRQGAVSAKRFYLMPILGMADPFEGVKFLKVASIDPGTGGKNADAGKDDGTPRTAIAFVIDTTISMKPYIEQSLNVIRSIYDNLEKDKLADDVGFAVVAFRNSTAARPGLEYDAKVISDFTTAKNRKALETELAKVEEAKVSSHAFNEDALAGIKTAVESLNWNAYSSRILVLITDAGPLPSSDKYASVKMDVTEMADFARAHGIWISVLHIKSPGGRQNHVPAEKAYRALSRLSDNRSNYLAVPAPTPAEGARQFAAVTGTLASGMVKMVRSTAEGKLMTKPKDDPAKAAATPEDQAARLAASLGYALQLEYLGQQRGNRAPSVVDSWIADMDLAQLAKERRIPTVEVAVLLTKNQLNDLSQQLKIIIDNAERTKKTDSRDFFQGILSASARMARDPNSPTQGKNLAEMGVLAEFLDGLPYKSDVMLLREEDWYRMSVGEQTAFINRLKSRIARYEEYDKDRANWESFGATNPGDWMYRVPLNMLP